MIGLIFQMKSKKIMFSIGVLVMGLVAVGGYFTEGHRSNTQNPCLDTKNVNNQLISLAEYQGVVDTSEWKKAAKVSASKFPSGIDIFYKIETVNVEEIKDEYSHKLTLLFTSIDNDGAIAYVYPHSGAHMQDHVNDLFLLRKKLINQQSISVVAKKSTGGVAVVTCQNGRKSVISIDLPGYAIQ